MEETLELTGVLHFFCPPIEKQSDLGPEFGCNISRVYVLDAGRNRCAAGTIGANVVHQSAAGYVFRFDADDC